MLDETTVTEGVLLYEVEILALKKGYKETQFGFALRNALEKTNGVMLIKELVATTKFLDVCGFCKEVWHDVESTLMNDPSSKCSWES